MTEQLSLSDYIHIYTPSEAIWISLLSDLFTNQNIWLRERKHKWANPQWKWESKQLIWTRGAPISLSSQRGIHRYGSDLLLPCVRTGSDNSLLELRWQGGPREQRRLVRSSKGGCPSLQFFKKHQFTIEQKKAEVVNMYIALGHILYKIPPTMR